MAQIPTAFLTQTFSTCLSLDHAPHRTAHPRLLHPWGGRSYRVRVLKKTHGSLAGVARVQPVNLLLGSAFCRPPDQLTPFLCVGGPVHAFITAGRRSPRADESRITRTRENVSH